MRSHTAITRLMSCSTSTIAQRKLARGGADDGGDLVGLAMIHSGGRFVQQQHRGFQRQGAGELHPALDGVRQFGGEAVAHVVDIEQPHQPRRPRRAIFFAPARDAGLLRALRCWATAMFSATVMSPNRRIFWNVRATPLRAIAAGDRPVMSRPPTSSRPEVGR